MRAQTNRYNAFSLRSAASTSFGSATGATPPASAASYVGAVVESGAMVAAGALVTAGKRVPSGELWAGSPAKFFRKLKPEEVAFFRTSAEKYAELGQQHKGGLSDA